MDHLSATTSDRYRTRLFDSSRIHHLDPSAKNYRAENEFFIDAFFRHRWYSGNHKRDGPSLLQAWNVYIHNLEHVDRCVPESFFDRVTQGLRGDLEHERDRRLQLADAVLKHRAEFAFAQLENERALTSLRDDLRVARGIADRSRDEIAALQTLVDAHHREHKALCEMLERKGVLHRKKQRTDGTA
uniref:Uncharacterized protein n=1 Tax=Peronospora matthiolae TaxID=2874970 RepID=A0AAV1TZQ6_9STRA